MSDTTYVDYVAPAVSAEWLNEVNDHVWSDTPVSGTTVHGSDVIEFTQTGTGAVQRTVQAKLRDVVSVKDFGAVGDWTSVGVGTDDTAAIQAAIDYAESVNGTVYFPVGKYLVTAPITAGCGLVGESSQGSRIIVQRPFVGNVISNNALASYWQVENLYFQHDVEADNSLDGSCIYLKDIEFYLIKDVATQVHGATAIGLNIDGRALGSAGARGTVINLHVTGAGATVPYNPAWDATAKSCRLAGIRIAGGSKQVTIINPFVESSYHGISIVGTDATKITRDNTIIGGSLNTCDHSIHFGDFAQQNVIMSTELIGYTSNLDAVDTDDCKQNVCYSVYPYGATGFTTYIKRNLLEFPAGSPTFPEKRFYGTLNLPAGAVNATRDQAVVSSLNRTGSDGTLLEFKREGLSTGVVQSTASTVSVLTSGAAVALAMSGGGSTANGGNILMYASASNNDIRLRIGGTEYVRVESTGNLIPRVDNTTSLGKSGFRWTEVWATNGTIQTSDANEKQQIRDLSVAEKAVATKLKALIKVFKFNHAVATKGTNARWHTGVIAQEVKAAFESEGLVAEDYGVYCFDQWDDQYDDEFIEKTLVDENGNETIAHISTGNKVKIKSAGQLAGVRYEELIAFVLATL